MTNKYRNLVYAMTGQPVFPQYYQDHQTPLPREKTVREDLEEVVHRLEEQERQQKSMLNKVKDKTKCTINSYVHGATYGASDEMAGMAGIVGNAIANLENNQDFQANYKKAYTDVRDDFRNYRQYCENNYPYLTLGTEMAGLMSQPISIFKQAATAPRSVYLANEMKNAIAGGATYGFGSGEGSIADQLSNMGKYTMMGALTPYLRRHFLSGYAPAFKGGELGAFRRGITDNLLQSGISNFSDKK